MKNKILSRIETFMIQCTCIEMCIRMKLSAREVINMSIFRVAIHYGVNSNGVLSYDTDIKNRNDRFT